MRGFLVVALVGTAAQLIAGLLGMGYGVTATTFLLALGTLPALASAAVSMASVGTTMVAGTAHWRVGNVDWRVVGRLAVPGAAGAIFGAHTVVSLGQHAKGFLAAVLLVMGIYVLYRTSGRSKTDRRSPRGPRTSLLVPLGLVAGFLDAASGGGWGVIATSTLLASQRLEPRRVIGSVETAQFVVALAATLGFLTALPIQVIDLRVVGGLMVGGMLGAPFAALLCRRLSPYVLGTAAGGLIILINGHTLLVVLEADGALMISVLTALGTAWVVVIALAARRHRTATTPEPDAAVGVPDRRTAPPISSNGGVS